MTEPLLLELDAESGIAMVTLNRPAAINAINQPMLLAFEALWRRVRDDDAIRAVVIRGHPDSRGFTAGADVHQGPDAIRRHPNVFANRPVADTLSPRAHGVWKPLIVAIHGVCAGAGMFLVNECDIVLCADDAQFFDPHMALGIVSATSPIGMSRRVNLGEVLRYTLLSNSERLGAETALRIGLVTEVMARDALADRAAALARIVAGYDPVAVQGTLKAIWQGLDTGRRAALDRATLYADAGRASTGRGLAPLPRKLPYEVR